MKKKFILLAMMLLTLIGGVKFNVLNAQQQYRVKVTSGSYIGNYLHVNSYYMSYTNTSNVGSAAYTESNNQIFTLENAGNGYFYLRNAAGYYIECGAQNSWNVDCYSETPKTPLMLDYTDATNFYIRNTKVSGNNYFKVESTGVYCDAANNAAATWTLEGPLSVIVSADKTEIWSDENVQLTAVGVAGVRDYSYSWSPAIGLDDATSATPIFTPTEVGIYTFTCTATDANDAIATSEEISILVKDVKDKPVIQEFTVGDGTGGTDNYFPTAFWYNYSLTQQIYTASELGFGAGKISGISFYGTLSYARTRTIDVYIRNIDETKFNNSTDWKAISSDDKVYSGSFTNKVGWVDIAFDKEFEYEGGNILICIDDNTGSCPANTPYYMNAGSSDIKALRLTSDGTNYDPFNIPNSYSGTSNSNNYIKFTVEVSTDPTIEVNYTSLDFGTVRAGGDFWTEKETPSFNVNVKAKNTTIKTITGNDDFFKFSDVTGAVDQTEFNFTVSYNKEAEAGEKSGNIVVTYMNGEEEATVEIPMTATAYVPAQGDVVENPIEVTFDENGVYTYTINSLDGFYDDYVFSPNEQYDADAPDMVFSFTLTEDALVHVYDMDENYVGSWCSLYGDFTVENGPQYKKDYPGEQLLSAGTYYVVVSPNELPFNLKIEKSSVPAPIIYYSSPMNESANNDNPELTWNMQYAETYKVMLGTSEDALEEVASETATQGQTEYSFQTSELQNNTKYYWQVIATNEAGTTTGEVRSFVTLLDVPQITSATAVNLYPGETTTITWDAVANATSYTVYNGEWTVLATLEATETSYELSGLEYNMTGHNITVTATQDLGESLKSTAVVVKVAGTFPLTVNVKDSNNNPIEGATVTVDMAYAYDEFGVQVADMEAVTTDAEGKVTITFPLLGAYGQYGSSWFTPYYTLVVSKSPYTATSTTVLTAYGIPTSRDFTLYLPTPSSLYPENYEYMLLAGQDLTLNWTDVEGVTGYNVYRRGAYDNSTGTYEYELLGTSTENTYTAVAEYDGEGSYYAVSAVFEGGLESDKISTSGRIYVLGTGDVKGLVTDTEGNPVAGAALELSGTNGFGEDIHILETEADGTFLVEDVIEGTYSLTVSHYNYEAKTVSGIIVEYNNEYDLGTIELTPKASIENVTVTADNNGNVSWTGDYAKWNVYRRNTNAPQELTPVATELEATSTTDTEWETLEPGTYQYGVAALVEPQAQTRGTEVIFAEGFENNGYGLPIGWTYSGNGSNWKVGKTDTYVSDGPASGEYFAFSKGKNYNLYAYLTTCEIFISDNSVMTFKYISKEYYGDVNVLKVNIKVEGNTYEKFTSKGEIATWQDGEINLSEFQGKTIQIEFVNVDSWGSGVGIDDILITKTSSSVETQIVWSNDVVKQGPATFIGGDTENPTAWNVDANWSTGSVPADGAEVTINANAVIKGAVNVSNVTINAGTSLTVANGGALTVTGTISQASNYLLVLEEGGQIFQNNANVTARFRMSIDNPSDWSDETNKDGWQFISMPMAGVTYDWFTGADDEYDLYKYDGSQDLEWLNHKAGSFAETEFISGKGYLASLKDAETATVYGTLNTSTYFSSYFAYNADKDLANFRLIGNPFTYDIKWGDMNPHQLADGFAIVNKDGIYEYYSGADAVIKVGQGFFIKAIAGESSYSQYIYSKQRSTRESNNSLNITATGNAGKDNVIINLAGKSEGFDKLQNFNDAIATVYVAEGGKNYGIYNCDADVQEVELNFNANQMGNYTISIEPNGKFQTVTLVDRFTGIETNMLVEDYHFTAMSNVNNNRFIVKLAVSDQQSAVSDNFVYQSGEDLIIDAEGTVQIIDVMGRVLLSDEVESTNNRINVSGFQNGTYMVRVINGSEVKVEKVVIY